MKMVRTDDTKKKRPSMMPPWIQLGVAAFIGLIIYAEVSRYQDNTRAAQDAKFSNRLNILHIEPVTPDTTLRILAINKRNESMTLELAPQSQHILPDGTIIHYGTPPTTPELLQ